MVVAVVGGSLQGVEAAYLAGKAGWDVRVIDRKAAVPASGLGQAFVQCDVTAAGNLDRALNAADLIIPALEDDAALSALQRWAEKKEVPLAFDPAAYAISSNKLKSELFFAQNGFATPESWPDCQFPVIAKPSHGSGSRGIRVYHDLDALKMDFPGALPPEAYVLQEYIQGNTYSLEVTGLPGRYRIHQVTDLAMDAERDCKRVFAPTELEPVQITALENLTRTLAQALRLSGIMDVEVIFKDGMPKILEIDARLPSQTPATVFWSTGQNLVRDLAALFVGGVHGDPGRPAAVRGVVYEHIRVGAGVLEVCGEHVMTDAGPLHIQQDFFGVDEALTNYAPGRERWVATLICTGPDRHSAWQRRNHGVSQIMKRFKLDRYRDPEPDI